MNKPVEVEKQLKEKVQELEKLLLEINAIAPLRFHDTDCEDNLYFYHGLAYDKERGEAHIDLTMWDDGLKKLMDVGKYYVIKTHEVRDGDIYLVKGEYDSVGVGHFCGDADHYNAVHCHVIAVAAPAFLHIDELSYPWVDYTIHDIVLEKRLIEAPSDEVAIERFRQLAVEEGW